MTEGTLEVEALEQTQTVVLRGQEQTVARGAQALMAALQGQALMAVVGAAAEMTPLRLGLCIIGISMKGLIGMMLPLGAQRAQPLRETWCPRRRPR
ncbi:MAG: hypothetical protein V3V08_17165 [Nannocystaceae bacterium]